MDQPSPQIDQAPSILVTCSETWPWLSIWLAVLSADYEPAVIDVLSRALHASYKTTCLRQDCMLINYLQSQCGSCVYVCHVCASKWVCAFLPNNSFCAQSYSIITVGAQPQDRLPYNTSNRVLQRARTEQKHAERMIILNPDSQHRSLTKTMSQGQWTSCHFCPFNGTMKVKHNSRIMFILNNAYM